MHFTTVKKYYVHIRERLISSYELVSQKIVESNVYEETKNMTLKAAGTVMNAAKATVRDGTKNLPVYFLIGTMITLMLGTFYPGTVKGSEVNRRLGYGKIGPDVRWVQEKLNGQGYQVGAVDGVYGMTTRTQVEAYQRKHNLKATGQVDSETQARLNGDSPAAEPASRQKSKLSEKDVMLLARAVNGEARGEPFEGQVAVASVILNRTKSNKFPKSVPGVIFQTGAFDAVSDGQIWLQPSDQAVKAAYLAARGQDNTGGALYYFNPAKSTSRWIWTRPVITQIGQHLFAR